ncbi:hypothetical protein MKW92_022540 [Papaver armeniacum]|nr:hypothetical protein MKW92_022540 [Papaver armeniacum]
MASEELDSESQNWPLPSCPEGQHECKEDDIFKSKQCSPPDDRCNCINCCIDPPTCECPDPDPPAPPSPPPSIPPPPSIDLEDLPPPPPSSHCPGDEPWRNDLCTEVDQKFKFPTTKPCDDACETGCDCLCKAMGSSVIDRYCIQEASKLDRCRCCCKDITGVERLQLSDSERESDPDDLQS